MGLFAGIFLAVIFATTSLLKFRDLKNTQKAIASMGIPASLSVAIIISTVELLTAVLLIVDPRTGGPCSVALLVAFTTLIIARLISGQVTGCSCFGARSSQILSWKDVVRNTFLIALGVISTLG